MGDIEKVKSLRQSTGAGFKDCNAALKDQMVILIKRQKF